ncbi:MAG: Gldg family protein [Acutalibacteraceae bacterium]
MNYKDEKENITENTSELNSEGKISEEAASALEAGTFEEKEKDGDNSKEQSEVEKKDEKKKRKNPFSSRRFRKGSFSVVLTCLVIVAVIVLNILVSVLQSKVPALSFDMTGQNLYELSQSSKELVSKVDKEVVINVLGKEDTYTKADENFLKANALLKKYAAENDKISINYVDLQSNPTYVNKYPNENITSYSYIVTCGDRYKYLEASTDLFTLATDQTTGSTYVQESNVESAVTSAIYYVTSDSQTKVTVLNGFSGSSQGSNLTTLTSLLKSNNYDVQEINLLTDEIPQDTDIAVLYQPTSDLTDEAAKRITDYLSNGGKYGKNLFYVPTFTKLDAPNIDSILEEWGMSLGQGVVAETDSSYLPVNNYYYSIYDYTGNEYTSDIKNSKRYLMGAYTRPVIINDASKVTAIATTSQSCALRSYEADEDWDATQHIEGSFNAGAVSVKTGDDAKSTLTVWGSEMSFYSAWVNSSTYVNSEYFVNLFNKLTNRQDTGIVIEGKNTQSAQLGIMTDQILLIGPAFMYLIPAATLVLGLIIWIRRRYR